MASVFKQSVVADQKRSVEIVRDTLDVNAEGGIKFRCRTGRGSGKGIDIPGDEAEEFKAAMKKLIEDYDMLVAKARMSNDVSTEVASESNTPEAE